MTDPLYSEVLFRFGTTNYFYICVFVWKCLDEYVIRECWNKCFESATSTNIDIYGAKRLNKCVSWKKEEKFLV